MTDDTIESFLKLSELVQKHQRNKLRAEYKSNTIYAIDWLALLNKIAAALAEICSSLQPGKLKDLFCLLSSIVKFIIEMIPKHLN